ncbi:MAG: Chorismate binding-like protein [Solirubrobacteraceae bacterium]|nr:Chorismate binding-like protein [Solirubrobacteraceae bacterium]
MTFQAVREALPSSLAPAQALLALRGDAHPFALVGDWAGGGALLGSEPLRVLSAGEDPFAALAELPAVAAGDAVVGGGWFGVLGYELRNLVERLPPSPPAPVPMAAQRLAFYDHVVRFDGERWWYEALREDHPRLGLWRERLASVPSESAFSSGGFAAVAPGEAGHLSAVAQCVTKIAEGELFQANLTLRLEASFTGDPLDVFSAALPVAQPRFGACVGGVVSLSPERFLRRVGRHVETDPIKGTATDAAALAASAKDAAEHVMIVDLMRNDLGRVCEYGSIVAQDPRVEPYAGVVHLVSTVSGELRADATDADLLRATFPPGSVTGAPKVQAMKVIAELEATRREAYTGAIGYASPIAGLELNVAIRSFEIARDRIWLGVGGGIVADSEPEAELAEALAKAAGPLSAVGWRLVPAVQTKTSTRRLPRALELAGRPNPRLGLLETILVQDGEAQHLEAHLARLTASARELYDREAPPDLRRQIESVSGTHRLRVTLTPDGATTLEALPLAPVDPPERFAPYVLPGGLGRHKWADRRLPDALQRDAGQDATPLILDTDGHVLEACWANVFVVEGDHAITPPADGRLLPGTHRARVDAREEPIDLDRLEAADDVFLTSALRRLHLRFEAAPARG